LDIATSFQLHYQLGSHPIPFHRIHANWRKMICGLKWKSERRALQKSYQRIQRPKAKVNYRPTAMQLHLEK